MKLCTKCRKWKDENQFYERAKTKGGFSYWCKDCSRDYARRRLHPDGKKVKKYYGFAERHRVVAGVKQKWCHKCKKWKPESQYYKRRGCKDGLSYLCRKCEREYAHKLLKIDASRLKKYYRAEQSHRVVAGVKQKRCRKCMKWWPETEFYQRSKHRDGLAVWCKQCADDATNDCRRRRTQRQRASLITP